MITVKLQGGLGNQMFQCAIGKSIAKRNNTDLILDLTLLNHRIPTRSKYTYRELQLDIFNFNIQTTLLSKAPKFLRNPAYVLQVLINKTRQFTSKNKMVYEKKAYYLDQNIMKLSDTYLDGFWQNVGYFKDIDAEIIKEFTSFRNPLSDACQAKLKEITDSNSVCVNFRRTDYVTNKQAKELYGELNNDYYQKALEMIAEKFGDIHVFVFSDDVAWSKQNFKTKYKMTYIEEDCAGWKYSGYFRLMMACKHNIIPNSTFAWWPAYLNQNKNKIVIAPKIWVTDKSVDPSGIFENNWIRI